MTMFLCTGCLKGLIYKRSGDLVDDLYQMNLGKLFEK